MPLQNITLPIQRRMAQVMPNTADDGKKTVDVVWSTGAMRRCYDWATDTIFHEELEISEQAIRMERMNDGASVLKDHRSYSLDAVIGIVQRAWIEGGKAFATLLIDDTDEDAAKNWNRILGGFIRHISVGYAVHAFQERREGDKRILRATDWEPMEVSFVAIGADAGAGVRSNPVTELPCKVDRIGDDMADDSKPEGEQTPEGESGNERSATGAGTQQAGQGNQPENQGAQEGQRNAADDASEILEICELAGADIRAARDFIARDVSPAEVRKVLTDQRQQRSDAEAISSQRAPDAPEGRSAKINPTEIYGRINNREMKHG